MPIVAISTNQSLLLLEFQNCGQTPVFKTDCSFDCQVLGRRGSLSLVLSASSVGRYECRVTVEGYKEIKTHARWEHLY